MNTNELNQLPEGTRIGNRYEIIEVIGQGGFGITYRGRDLTLDVLVAIKEYYPSGIASRLSTQSLDVQVGGRENKEQFEKGKAKFLEEARMLARISDDPNVVGVRDFFEDNRTAYIVMQFLEGESLKTYMDRNGKMTFKEAFELLRPVMHSLDHIHKNGLIHRDISPSNLIRQADGSVKLIDFGTTREISLDGEKSISIMLKPGFAPPEQYKSRGNQGPWTDVYAMCASIYRIITGITPENSLARVLVDELASPNEVGADITAAQEKALMKGLAVDYRERFQDMTELEEALDLALNSPEGEPSANEDEEKTVNGPLDTETIQERTVKEVSGRRVKKAGKVKKQRAASPAKRKKRIIFAAALGLLVIAAAVTFLILNSQGVFGPATIAGGRVTSYASGEQHVNFGSSGETTVITSDMIDELDKSQKVNEINFNNCILSDDVITRMGSMQRIEKIKFNCCSGFTTLDPLSGITTLSKLTITGPSSEITDINGDELFGSDFPNILEFELSYYNLKGTAEFLGHFTGMKVLTINSLEMENGSQKMPDMPSLEKVYITGTDLSRMDLQAFSRAENLIIASFINDSLSSLSFLIDADSLQYVYAEDNLLTSAEGLGGKPSIREIEINNNQISDISDLAGLTGLSTLNANDNQISDISALSGCSDLKWLYLRNNQINDVTALSGCSKLIELNLSNNIIEDLSAIASCEGMETLNISNNRISDLAFLEKMLVLKKLSASDNDISDLSDMSNITQLRTAFLANNQITDISVLAKNKEHLSALDLDGNSVEDISPLKACTNLKGLSVCNNKLTTLKGLEGCAELYYLAAAGNRISDISALVACTKLYAADLGENEITDITALGESASPVMALLLQNNRIQDISPLYGEKNYAYLALYNNEITDISPLAVMNGITSTSVIYLEWAEGLDMDSLINSNYRNPKLIGVPLDRQVNMQNEFKAAKKAENIFSASIQFITADEAESDIADVRSKIRDGSNVW